MQVPFSSVNRSAVRLPPPTPLKISSHGKLKIIVGANSSITGVKDMHVIDMQRIVEAVIGMDQKQSHGHMNVSRQPVLHILVWFKVFNCCDCYTCDVTFRNVIKINLMK